MQDSIRALFIGAHPDDCEYQAGGLAAKYRRLGHTVKFVSVTNGDAGHHKIGGLELARRRLVETQRVAEEFGIEYEVWDVPDGYLVADIPNRDRMIRSIRAFKPDLIFTHRLNDYHPDHRATGTLVQDASFLIRVPNICPDTPAIEYRLAILSLRDGFTKPAPFTPDVIVAIDDVLDEKARMWHAHTSQFYEWLPYIDGYEAEVPLSDHERLAFTRRRIEAMERQITEGFRDLVLARYGEQEGRAVCAAEAFEVSEYGRPLPPDEIDRWFPR